jgi:SAM-dependent methyltransferase
LPPIDSAAQAPELPPALLPLLPRPKPFALQCRDLACAPVRMLLPDPVSEKLGISSLRAERLAVVLDQLSGRCLDIGAQDNLLLHLYRNQNTGANSAAANDSVGVDVVDWGGDCVILPSSDKLPFPDQSFDTVSFVACLNHIPERRAALVEARRVLRPEGRILVTMINRFVGGISHRLRWWGEHSQREVHVDEDDGLRHRETIAYLQEAGFVGIESRPFFYGLNRLYIGRFQV